MVSITASLIPRLPCTGIVKAKRALSHHIIMWFTDSGFSQTTS